MTAIRPSRGPLAAVVRTLTGIGAAFLALLAFGVAVSVTSYCRTPAVVVATAPDSSARVTEVTQLYPVRMARVVTPHTVQDIADAVRSAPGRVSIGGGRYSMGGQTATPDGLQLDMRQFTGVVALDTMRRGITVHSGTRWRDVQAAIDRAGLAVKIMQTYNTFTVGGALSVDAHGRYIGQGPLVRSVRGITLVLADGTEVYASPFERSDLFYSAIGGYGAVGVIADVSLDLAVNSRVRRDDETMPLGAYLAYFRQSIRDDSTVVFHNADVYPPDFETVHAVSYRRTTLPVTVKDRLLPADQNAWSHRTAYSIFTTWPKGKWIRQHVVDPVIFRGNPVTWRNYEASYDVSELEPSSREGSTYVLQEYFVPVDSVGVFTRRLRAVLRSHDVNAMNLSIRHALPDPGTYLAWAPDEVFAFVLYYRQRTDPAARREVGRWTRELIDSALASGGRYYLPYQPVATREQFRRAYPRADELFAVKRRVDPASKFTNVLWDLYRPEADGSYAPFTARTMPAVLPAEVQIALDTVKGYARSEAREYLTHPEWDLVYGSEAYARWLEAARRPSQFPYIGSVGTFWRAYADTWRAAHDRYSIDAGTHVMLGVIGVSTAVEYGLKGVYEGTVGRVSELAMPDGGTAEDRYAARVARDYAKLIATRGWYEFPFGHALAELWRLPMTGAGFARRWERRLALTAEYAIKAGYAKVIGLGTKAGYTPDDFTRYMVGVGHDASMIVPSLDFSRSDFHIAGRLDRGYQLFEVGRYNDFRDELLRLSEYSDRLRLAEISGCEVVTLSGTAPIGWSAPPRTSAVVAYAMPDDPTRVRALLQVSARDLLDVLHAIRAQGRFTVEHIYDY